MEVSLITGATSGIGEALAHQLGAKKHNLLLVARNEQKLKQLSEELSVKNNINAQYIAADLSKPNAANLIFEESKKRNLSVTLLVNNAGAGSSGEFVHNNLKSELDIIQLNNAALVALCHLYLPDMIKNKSGSIINVASVVAFFPSPYMAVYAASKAFVRSFTEALTEECKPYGVHVMLLSPGLTGTNFLNTKATNNDWSKTLINSRIAQTPEQVAKEMIQALDKKKTFHVSGRKNALAVKIAALIPDATIVRFFARRKRKQVN